jgi:hypothetical protein
VTLYKAVRPDGASFYDPSFRWLRKDGTKPVTHPAQGGLGYLSASTSEADCTGFRWPCRLLTVEPVGDLFTPDAISLPNKRAASAFRVTGEVEAWRAFGPNGQHVAAVIDKARTIIPQQATGLFAARAAARDAARDATRAAARAAARDAAWDAARAAAWDAAWDAAWAAARDATRAATVRDLITPEQYDLLAGPWEQVMGA